MELTKDNITDILQMEGLSGFKKDHLIKIGKILKKEFNNLSGKYYSTFSGGGCEHMFFQLKDLRWIGFHNSIGIDGGVSVSKKPFKTSKSHERDFFENDESNNEDYYPAKVTNAEFLAAEKIIVQWCKEKNKDISFLYPRGK